VFVRVNSWIVLDLSEQTIHEFTRTDTNKSKMIRRLLIFINCLALLSHAGAVLAVPMSAPAVLNLRAEYQENPIGIDVRQPRWSWQIQSARRGT